MEKKPDGNYTRILWAILNKSWEQHPIKQQLYGHQPPITKTIKIRRTRHAGHCWRSRYELISDLLLWTPSHGRAKTRRPAQTYIQQLCANTGCNPEDLPKAMDDKEGWRERVRNICADSATWWWWWWWHGKESRQVVGKAGWHHYGTVSSVFESVCLTFESRLKAIKKKEKLDFSDNSKFATWKLCFLI